MGALGDHLALALGDGGDDVQDEAVGAGQVAASDLHVGLEQPRDELHVPGEAVQPLAYPPSCVAFQRLLGGRGKQTGDRDGRCLKRRAVV